MNKYIIILLAALLFAPMAYGGTMGHTEESIEVSGNEGKAYLERGLKLLDEGELAEAAKNLESALPRVEKHGKEYETVLEKLCDIYMEVGDNAAVNRLMGLIEEHNRHELSKECSTPECHLERAEYFKTTGDAAGAKNEFLAIFAMQLTDAQRAKACHEYARFLTSQNDYAQAGDYYLLAAHARESIGGECEASVQLKQMAGLCYSVGKEYAKAIDMHREVIGAVERNGYAAKLKVSSLHELGKAHKARREFEKAKECFSELITYLVTRGEGSGADCAKAYDRLASVERLNREYDEWLRDSRKAIEIYTALGMHDEAAQIEVGIEDSEIARKQREEKLRGLLQASKDGLEQGGDYLGKLSRARVLATIAGCYGQLGDCESALDYYAEYVDVIRVALMEDFILKNPKERELTWRQELTNINEMGALMREVPSKSPGQLPRLANLIYEGQLIAKGILLSSEIEFEKILTLYGTAQMRDEYVQIKADLAEIEDMRQRRAPIGEILERTRATEGMQLELARKSAERGVYTDFLKYRTADVANALKSDEAAVEFVTLATGVVPNYNMMTAVVVSKEYPAGLALPIGTVGELSKMRADPARFSKDEYGANVWGAIMQAAKGKKRIYFAPDGVIHSLGIEYLSYGGRPLSEQVELYRLSSTRELCRSHKSEPLRYVALFGDIDYTGEQSESVHPEKIKATGEDRESDGENFARLFHTRREIESIAEMLKKRCKGCEVSPYSGGNATKERLLKEDSHPLNLLHIATHGAFLAGEKSTEAYAMSNSVLAFAGANLYDDPSENMSLVNAAEISGMSLHGCELVALSACESGLGKLGDDGVFGLQRGFKNAGAKTLLVSLNKVADEATADMMIAFYHYFIEGRMSKRAALSKAQSEIRSKYPGQDTWASFIMIDPF